MPNKTQQKNLRKLAEYLINLSAKYNKEHFRMKQFLEHNYDAIWVGDVIEQDLLGHCICNTSACAVGHAPLLFPAQVKKIIAKYDAFNASYNGRWTPRLDLWNVIADELFGVGLLDQRDFSWLFGGEWDSGTFHSYHATSWAVADRIMWYLDEKWDGLSTYALNYVNEEWERAKFYSVEAGLISKEELEQKIAEIEELETV